MHCRLQQNTALQTAAESALPEYSKNDAVQTSAQQYIADCCNAMHHRLQHKYAWQIAAGQAGSMLQIALG